MGHFVISPKVTSSVLLICNLDLSAGIRREGSYRAVSHEMTTPPAIV